MARPVQGIADLIVQAKHWRERVITGDSRAFLDDVIARLEFDAKEFDRLMGHPSVVMRYQTVSDVVARMAMLMIEIDTKIASNTGLSSLVHKEREWLADIAHGRIQIGSPKLEPWNVRSPDLRSPPDPDGG